MDQSDQERAAVKAMDLGRPASIAAAVSSIGEGPAVDFDMSDEVKRAQYPFAYRLWRHLENNSAVLGFQAGEYRHGDHGISGPVGGDGIVHMWSQFNASRDDQAEELGDLLMKRFGKFMTFGQMFMPAAGMQWAGLQKAGPVWVRQIGVYAPQTDSIVQRFDVLVRETHEAKIKT